jgi:hypothetical protein
MAVQRGAAGRRFRQQIPQFRRDQNYPATLLAAECISNLLRR